MSGRGGSARRIVSLVPSLTELVAAWGLGGRLVGRTRYCVEPAWVVDRIPEVGGTKDPDLARLLALRPDLVLMECSENSRETAVALETARVPFLALDIHSVDACVRASRVLGWSLGCEAQGEATARRIQARLAVPPAPALPAVVLLWRDPWVLAGDGTYLADLLRCSGFQALGPSGYARLSDEALAALDPDHVFLPDDPYPFTAVDATDLRRLLPQARFHAPDGRALAWCLSRTADGLRVLKDLRLSLDPSRSTP